MNFRNSPSRLLRGGLFSFVLPFLLLLLSSNASHAQFKFREAPNREDPSVLSEEDGERVWHAFLLGREVGRFALSGTLVHRPPDRSSESYGFHLDGNWSFAGERSTITLKPINGRPIVRESVVLPEGVFLPAEDDAGNRVMERLSTEQLHEPFMDLLPVTWQDLLMPYLHWERRVYLGPERHLGRPAHRFALFNPEKEAFPSKVVVTVDEDYAALLKASLFDFDGNLVKRVRVGGFGKFAGEWMFNEINWELRPTRESLKLVVDSFSLLP
ncbi:MAG: hypothetical protein ACP5I4_00355 [Oceanipulchritudo sp.]